MLTKKKYEFDSLEVLRKATSDSFQFRTSFEWKISIALWTAEAALIGILLTKSSIIPLPFPIKIIASSTVCLIIILHFCFVCDIKKSHVLNRELEIIYRNEMWKMFPDIKAKISERPKILSEKCNKQNANVFQYIKNKITCTEKDITKSLKERLDERKNKKFTYAFQWIITGILGLIIIMILCSQPAVKTNKPQKDSVEYHINNNPQQQQN